MGQARLRGTKEERTTRAIALVEQAREARRVANRDRILKLERARAARWAAMSEEQKAAALERAKQDVETYSELQNNFGPVVADFLMGVDNREEVEV